MGIEADHLTEQGMDELMLHQRGECDSRDPCQYCAEEDESTRIRHQAGDPCFVEGYCKYCEETEKSKPAK